MMKFLSETLIPRLRRVTTSGSYQPEVDGVRFIAIALVLVQHIHERVIRHSSAIYPGISEEMLAVGVPGVAVFFSLSGLILYRGLRSSLNRSGQIHLGPYLWRRVTRLEPPYIIVMTLILLIIVVTGYQGEHTRNLQRGPDNLFVAWLASMFYSYGLIFGLPPKLNVVAWSLETEVQFYIMAPLIAYALYQLPSRWRLFAITTSALLWAIWVSPIAATSGHFRMGVGFYLPVFLMGILVEENRASSAQDSKSPVALNGIWGDAIAVISFTILLTYEAPTPLLLILSRSCCVLGALYGFLHGKHLRAILRLPWIATIGGMCYSIYLIHLAVIEVASKFTVHIGQGLPYPIYLTIQIGLMLAILTPASLALYLLIERPCMEKHWPSRLWQFISPVFQTKPRPLNLTNKEANES